MTLTHLSTARSQDGVSRTRTAIATVCLSGTLEDKLAAASAAGFDGVEIFEADLVASTSSPAEVRSRCADLGLSIDIYQPFRDLDSRDPRQLAANLRRAERKFALMGELGTDLVLVCSSVSADAVTDDDQLAEQLVRLAEQAEAHGMRIAYEALAWGTHVSTFAHSWEIVRRADHPALGLCLDSFHVLARGSDPTPIRDIPGDKLFFLQLADAPRLDMGPLEWSRHHRLFPGQGDWDLAGFVGHTLAAGYRGPLSLEVFNDVFRQADPRRTAVDARRSLLVLQDAVVGRVDAGQEDRAVLLPRAPDPSGFAFVELAVDGVAGPQVATALAALGFTHSGHHRTKPVQLWSHGPARVLLNTGPGPRGGAVAALGVQTSDPAAAAARAEALLAPRIQRVRGPAEADLTAVAAPDGTGVYFCPGGQAEDDTDWLADFTPTAAAPRPGIGITHVDHVGLTQPFDHFDETTLFYRSVLGLQPHGTTEVGAPFGLIRSRAVTAVGGRIRLALTVSRLRRGEWGPEIASPQYVAFACSDVLDAVRAARRAGAPMLDVPDNYYEDLDARLAPPPELLAQLRELGVFYERTADGEYLHAYTELLGGAVFLALVGRTGRYAGEGVTDTPVRMAAHRRARLRRGGR